MTLHQSAPLERVTVQGVLALTLKVMLSAPVAAKLYASTASQTSRRLAYSFSGVICVSISNCWHAARAAVKDRQAMNLTIVFISRMFYPRLDDGYHPVFWGLRLGLQKSSLCGIGNRFCRADQVRFSTVIRL